MSASRCFGLVNRMVFTSKWLKDTRRLFYFSTSPQYGITQLKLENLAAPTKKPLTKGFLYVINDHEINVSTNTAVTKLNSFSESRVNALKNKDAAQLLQRIVELHYTHLYSQLPSLNKILHRAVIQLAFIDDHEKLMEPVLDHPVYGLLKRKLYQEHKSMTVEDNTSVLGSLMLLSTSVHDPIFTDIIQDCVSRFDEYTLQGLCGLVLLLLHIDKAVPFLNARNIMHKFKDLMSCGDARAEMNVRSIDSGSESDLLCMCQIGLLMETFLSQQTSKSIMNHIYHFLKNVLDNEHTMDNSTFYSMMKFCQYHQKYSPSDNCLKETISMSRLYIKRNIQTLNSPYLGLVARYLRFADPYTYKTLMKSFTDRAKDLFVTVSRITDIMEIFEILSISWYKNMITESEFVSLLNELDKSLCNLKSDVLTLKHLIVTFSKNLIPSESFVNHFHDVIIENIGTMMKFGMGIHSLPHFLVKHPFLSETCRTKFGETILENLKNNKYENLTLDDKLLLHLMCAVYTKLPDSLLSDAVYMISNSSLLYRDALSNFAATMRLMSTVTTNEEQCSELETVLCERIYKLLNSSLSHHLPVEVLQNVRYMPNASKSLFINYILKILTAMAPEHYSTKDLYTIVRSLKWEVLIHRRSFYSPKLYDLLASNVIRLCETDNRYTPRLLYSMCMLLSSASFRPTQFDKFMELCECLIEENLEQDMIMCLSMLNDMAQLGHFPISLLTQIFSQDYMEYVDKAVAHNIASYEVTSRLLSELNRAVVIECPELKAPWFNEDYFESSLQASLSPLNDEVYCALKEVVGEDYIQSNTLSKYFHLIDYILVLDSNNRPIKVANTDDPLKLGVALAVLVHHKQHYCYRSVHLTGNAQMKVRQLQLLGYRVVEIPHFDWYRMLTVERVNYLQDKIFQNVPRY